MSNRFVLIPSNQLEPLLYSRDGLRLCLTSRAIRRHFLRAIVSADSWDMNQIDQFSFDFTQWITRLITQNMENYKSGCFPRLQHLMLHLQYIHTFHSLNTFESLRYLEISQYYGLDLDPELLPPNLTCLRFLNATTVCQDVQWPKSLTKLEFYSEVILNQWPSSLQRLFIQNRGFALKLPAPLPPTLTFLHLGFYWKMDIDGFVPNFLTHLVIDSSFHRGDDIREAWISECEHVIHFQTDIQGGPLILPPNVQHVQLPHYIEAVTIQQLPKSVISIQCPHVPNASEIHALLQKRVQLI